MLPMENITDEEVKFGLPGIYIPAEVFLNPNLTLSEKMTFGLIKSLSKSSKGCWATNRYLGNLLGCSKNHITKILQKLNENHYIIIKWIKIGPNKQRRIYEATDYMERYKLLVQNFHDNYLTWSIEKGGIVGQSRVIGGTIPCDVGGNPPGVLEYNNIRTTITNVIDSSIDDNLSFNFVKDKDVSFSDKNDFSLVLKSNNPNVYTVIQYWNSLNIRKHNIAKQTKTIDLIINSINTLLKKYTIEDILESFKTYKYIIDLYPKKFRKGSLYFVGLNDFIRYNKNTLKFVDHIPIELQSIKGLFEICVKGNDYAKVYFKPTIFAKDSKLAKLIETNFINTLGQNKVIGKETLIEKITNLFIRFYDTNLTYFNFTAADRKSKTTIVNWMFDYIETKNKFEVHFAAREPFFIDFGNWLIEEAMMKE